MKWQIISLIILILLCSCNTREPVPESCTLHVRVGSKSANETQTTDLFVYDEEGILASYARMSGGVSLQLRSGHSYIVKALTGIPGVDYSKTGRKHYLDTLSFAASDLNLSDGFPYCAETEINMTGNDTDIALTMDRMVSKLTVSTVIDSLKGVKIRLLYAFLSNVRAMSDLKGNCSGWLNPMGRCNESPIQFTHIIDGDTSPADCPDLTFAVIGCDMVYGDSLKLDLPLYCLPNDQGYGPEGFSSSMTDRQTRLVLVAELDGKRCFYPYSLPAFVRNVAYGCRIIIRNPGSSDPELPLEADIVQIEPIIDKWTDINEIPTLFNQLQ